MLHLFVLLELTICDWSVPTKKASQCSLGGLYGRFCSSYEGLIIPSESFFPRLGNCWQKYDQQ
jgi:hypothetical protein